MTETYEVTGGLCRVNFVFDTYQTIARLEIAKRHRSSGWRFLLCRVPYSLLDAVARVPTYSDDIRTH